jgi:valyl-tRNA synthetase
MSTEFFPPRYDYTENEKKTLAKWKARRAFEAAVTPRGEVVHPKRKDSKPYVIAIPPPNVTGRLHMGHALNNTLQDMLIRYHRMNGRDALWIPGTDHAGIATQTVVKKMLDAEGIDYRELGREKFTERVWQWKQKYGDIILEQLSRLGASCDFSRTRFTMDEGLSRGVLRAFKKLYDDGLIYRGSYIVNWCPVDQTALSDDEIETKEGGEPGFLYHIRYALENGSGELVVATTRPETLFGDVAIAVHPNDERYQSFIGQKVKLPLTDKTIPVIADSYVDMAFGTGCLKITPAHDPNDFEVGKRHGFEPINIMNADATLNELVPKNFQGLSREKARTLAVKELEASGLLAGQEPRSVPVGRSYRSKAIIEYRLSEQWFVKMKPLAEQALAQHNKLRITPAQWDKVYLHWMNNIRDWCISRQLWWGHRIPAWYHVDTGEILVEETTPERVKMEPTKWRQDEDVLDTWFSSDLWPMSILGWPEKTEEFKRYFPTTTLSTAKDIIYLWVARMNMMAVHFEGKLPYQNVLVHPTVMDERGETMSKSKGNGIDPIHIIEGATSEMLTTPVLDARPNNMKDLLARIQKNYPAGFEGVGADALRYTLIYLCSSGQELRLSMDNFVDLGRRFVTKLWNAARFVMLHAESYSPSEIDFSKMDQSEDRWMALRLEEAAKEIDACYEKLEFTTLGTIIYELVWNDFCDWYVEIAKVRLNSNEAKQKGAALYFLFENFSKLIRLIHPLMPFVTEELWDKLHQLGNEKKLWKPTGEDDELLMLSAFKVATRTGGDFSSELILGRFNRLKKLVSAIRTIRASYQVPDKERLLAVIHVPNLSSAEGKAWQDLLEVNREEVIRLAGLLEIKIGGARPANASASQIGELEFFIDLAGYRDPETEKKRLQKEHDEISKELASLEKRLGNDQYLAKAKPEEVDKAKLRLSELKSRSQNLTKELSVLN